MQLSSGSSRKKKKPTTGKAVVVNQSPGSDRGEGAIVESSCDETLSLGTSRPGKMPGLKQGDGVSLSHSSLSQSSVPIRESAWSTNSAPSNVARSSQCAVPTEMSPQSSTVEAQHNNNNNNNNINNNNSNAQAAQLYPNIFELKSEERGLYLIQLLLSCAHAVATANMEYTNSCLEHLSYHASLTGDSMQRVSSYFMEGLAARSTRSWPGVFKALHTTQYPSTVEVLSARQVFFNVCPYLKFAFLTINQAILDSMEGEKVVHIVDLQASDAVQWLALLQALRARPGGAPHLKITAINEKKDVLDLIGQLLIDEAEKLEVPFQFVPVVSKLDNVGVDMLKVKPGEAIAVSSVMRLHLLLNEEEQGTTAAPTPTANGGTADPEAAASESDVPKGEVVNGHLNDSKERCVFRSIGGGAFERVETGDTGTSSGERERGSKRSRDANDGDHLRRKASPGMEKKGGGVPQGGFHTVNRQHGGDSGERSEVLDRERGTPVAATPLSSRAANFDMDQQGVAMDKVLRMLKVLGPKVMVVVEQESNHNGSSLMERFVEALHYYCALFDSLDSTLPQQCFERVTLEKNLFGVEIKNIVACEGLERVERHEKLDKWKARLRKAGFNALPLSYSTVMQAKRLLGSYQCEGYRLNEGGGCLTLAWQETPLYSASAWHA